MKKKPRDAFAKIVKDRTVKMSENVTNQQLEDLKLAPSLSITVDESCDLNDTTQVSLFVQIILPTGSKKELLGLLSLKGQKQGVDIVHIKIERFEKHRISKVWQEQEMGLSLCWKTKLIMREALCLQTFPDEICKVMELVIKIVNSIVAKLF